MNRLHAMGATSTPVKLCVLRTCPLFYHLPHPIRCSKPFYSFIKRCRLHTCSFRVTLIQLYYLQSSDRITLREWPGALWPPSSWNRRLLEEPGHGVFHQHEQSGENGLHKSHNQEPNGHPGWVSKILYVDETEMQHSNHQSGQTEAWLLSQTGRNTILCFHETKIERLTLLLKRLLRIEESWLTSYLNPVCSHLPFLTMYAVSPVILTDKGWKCAIIKEDFATALYRCFLYNFLWRRCGEKVTLEWFTLADVLHYISTHM